MNKEWSELNKTMQAQIKKKDRRKRHSKGFYDPQTGQTFIVLPNITTLADAEATVLRSEEHTSELQSR